MLRATGCDRSADCRAEGTPCQCLLELSPEKLLRLTADVSWAPTVDGVLLKMHPAKASREGAVHAGVPILIGTALEDSFINLGAGATDWDFRKYLSTQLEEERVEEAYRLYMTPAFRAALTEESNKGLRAGQSAAYWAARRVYADYTLTCPARRAAMSWLKHTSAPAYWYLWDVGYPQTGNLMPTDLAGIAHTKFHIGSCYPCPGAGHGSDQAYLFQVAPGKVRRQAEWLSATYPALLADFVRTSDPNLWNGFNLHRGFARAWPTAESGSGMWFQMNHTLAEENLRSQVCDFWDSLRQ